MCHIAGVRVQCRLQDYSAGISDIIIINIIYVFKNRRILRFLLDKNNYFAIMSILYHIINIIIP